jgi:hypothetical protein
LLDRIDGDGDVLDALDLHASGPFCQEMMTPLSTG